MQMIRGVFGIGQAGSLGFRSRLGAVDTEGDKALPAMVGCLEARNHKAS